MNAPMQPKPTTYKYADLISKVQTGFFKIPKFQREFVWSIEKSAKLMDSIVRGYPIGTFTIWQTQKRLSHIRNLGGADIPDTPDGYPVNYVLDGQQRLATIFVTIKGCRIGNKDYKKIYLDLERNEGEIITSTKSESSITIHELLTNDQVYLDESYSHQIRKKIIEYKTIFSTYDFSVIELHGYPIEKAVDVFTRINTTGKALTLFEIMVAKTHDEEDGFFLDEKFEKLREELDDVKYDITGSTLLQAMAINLTKNCTKNNIISLDKNRMIQIYEKTTFAIKNAIDYFRSQYNIQASRMLPYDSLIVPFQYFFFKNDSNQPNNTQRRGLQEYFWKASLSSRFSSGVESKLEQDCKRIDSILDDNIPKFEDLVVKLNPTSIKNHKFATNEAISKSVLCVLASFEPKSFKNNSRINLDNSYLHKSNGRNYHHFFPTAYLKNLGMQNSNIVANITIINANENLRIGAKPPSVYIEEMKSDNSELNTTLRDHLIDDVNEFGVNTDDYELFIQKRSERIYEELEKKMNP